MTGKRQMWPHLYPRSHIQTHTPTLPASLYIYLCSLTIEWFSLYDTLKLSHRSDGNVFSSLEKKKKMEQTERDGGDIYIHVPAQNWIEKHWPSSQKQRQHFPPRVHRVTTNPSESIHLELQPTSAKSKTFLGFSTDMRSINHVSGAWSLTQRAEETTSEWSDLIVQHSTCKKYRECTI